MSKMSKAIGERNWLIWFDDSLRVHLPHARRWIAWYFRPHPFEMYGAGILYRALGVSWLAWLIPTGGMLWRRLFHWDGWSFALGGSSIRHARAYRYNTCVFELLHLGALLAMTPDGLWAISVGYLDGILKFVLAGLLMNGYPLLLQRYNRVRIQVILNNASRVKQRTQWRHQEEICLS